MSNDDIFNIQIHLYNVLLRLVVVSGLGNISLQQLQERLGTVRRIGGNGGGSRLDVSLGGFGSVVCSELRGEIGRQGGCVRLGRERVGLDGTNVCVLSL